MASLASFEAASRRIQSIADAFFATLRSWAARKGKEEVELAQARAKIRETRKGLLTILTWVPALS